MENHYNLRKSFQNDLKEEPTNNRKPIKRPCRNLMRKKVPARVYAELTFAPIVLQIKDSSGGNLRREPTTHALGAFGPGADRSASGKVPHVALVRWSSCDEGVFGCFACDLQLRVSKGRISIAKRYKMDFKPYPKLPAWRQEDTNVNQGISQNTSWGMGSNKWRTMIPSPLLLGTIFDQNHKILFPTQH